ncbi:hypothetical protein BSZ19_24685 [Bradyrhizobium japonicum]|uniref:Uncharacterized protein n=1 Tax=Bradyrhizobium japonicum TaxID=375 RepID=A0A1Y2JK75_BRAJP|nr:hypothetical protein BSZ19_24685 [Bradyrhizobium japonicum]
MKRLSEDFAAYGTKPLDSSAAPDSANDRSTIGSLAALDYRAAVVPGVAAPCRLAHDHVAFDYPRRRANDFFFPDLS